MDAMAFPDTAEAPRCGPVQGKIPTVKDPATLTLLMSCGPYQVSVPHLHFLDFLVWPKIRDLAIQSTALQNKLEMDACTGRYPSLPLAVLLRRLYTRIQKLGKTP